MTRNGASAPQGAAGADRAAWIALAVLLLAAAAVRWRLLDVPLERDEGEYAYGGQLLLRGLLPYVELYNMKLPGIYATYAGLLAVFGQTPHAIHLGLLLANLATSLGLFLLGRRLLGRVAGLVAAAGFAALSLHQSVQGLYANAEHFVLVPAVLGCLVLVQALEAGSRRRLYAAGLLLGAGFVVKQHGALFLVFGGLLVLLVRLRGAGPRRTLAELGCLAAGGLTPYAVTCLVYLAAGAFDRFWFWTFEYARAYATQEPWSVGMAQLATNGGAVLGAAPVLAGLALLGLAACAFVPAVRARAAFLVPFALCGLLATAPGLVFRPHYFVLALPGLCLAAGAGLRALLELLARAPRGVRAGAGGVAAAVAVLQPVHADRELLFSLPPPAVTRAVYGLNPFPESVEIGRLIRERTNEGDRVAVVGSEPELYFYSGRRAATGFVYTYPLMETHPFALTMQKDFIREVEVADPEILVFVDLGLVTSWLPRPGSHDLILRWFQDYKERFDLIAAVDFFSYQDIRFVSPSEIAGRKKPPGRTSVEIYQRRAR